MHSPGNHPFTELSAAGRGEPLALLHGCGVGPVRLFRGAVDVLEVPAAEVGTALDQLEAFLARHSDRICVGYLGFDLRDAVEPLERSIAEDFAVPVMHFTAYEQVQTWAAGETAEIPVAPTVPPARGLRTHLSRAAYEARVAQVVEHICAGDIFQANLTQPFTGQFDGDPRALFWRLCEVSPAPFSTYLELADGTAILSSSPEEFLRLDGDLVRSEPIKGTRPRSSDPKEDASLLRELLASEKDQAELAMIVDLLRNDIGKVAEVGSVAVGPFPDHASFAQVHHLYSRITARLREGTSVVDLLRATFPGGSITGAPKLRCMEIIESLELVRRGVYTGSIGWIGPGSQMHLNIAIRTMTCKQGQVRFNTGGGITADSDPALEYEETLHKAAGLIAALQTEVLMP